MKGNKMQKINKKSWLKTYEVKPMITIEYKINNVFGNEVKSLKTVKPFKVNTVREAIDICEDGVEKDFAVFVNDKKYIPMKGLGRTIDLTKEVA
jgi:hypothetical protein